MSGEQVGVGSRVKIFVESAVIGVDGVERIANKWLENNPLVAVRGIQLSVTEAAYILTIWYSGSASS